MERLIEMFEEIIDVRDSSGKRHCLTHILVMSVCGILQKSGVRIDIWTHLMRGV